MNNKIKVNKRKKSPQIALVSASKTKNTRLSSKKKGKINLNQKYFLKNRQQNVGCKKLGRKQLLDSTTYREVKTLRGDSKKLSKTTSQKLSKRSSAESYCPFILSSKSNSKAKTNKKQYRSSKKPIKTKKQMRKTHMKHYQPNGQYYGQKAHIVNLASTEQTLEPKKKRVYVSAQNILRRIKSLQTIHEKQIKIQGERLSQNEFLRLVKIHSLERKREEQNLMQQLKSSLEKQQ